MALLFTAKRYSLLLLLFQTCSLIPGVAAVPPVLPDEDGFSFPTELFSFDFPTVATTRRTGGLNESTFILAAERTARRDPINNYQNYTGGWNITNQHYWASVAFSGAPYVIAAGVWFIFFGVFLLLTFCCFCFCPKANLFSCCRLFAYRSAAFCIFVFLLIPVICGSAVLFYGQARFHRSTDRTLDYIVGQANFTVNNVRNLSISMDTAKHIRVVQFFLPPKLQNSIDVIQRKLKSSADQLSLTTNQISLQIHHVLQKERLVLILTAIVMLALTLLGLAFSLLEKQVLVYILVFAGWFLVTGIYILTGAFLLIHNVFADTCVAMGEWVANPHSHTALDGLLPCVDYAIAEESLYQSRAVTYQLVNVVNNAITNVSNQNFPPSMIPLYYNQSGPPVPLLCNPFFPNVTHRKCSRGEVRIKNAAERWKKYICKPSLSSGSGEICETVGRFTPDVYNQIVGATNLSFGLYHYAPFLMELQDCSFVRETFSSINTKDCPGIVEYSRWVYVGLLLVSISVMGSVFLWVVYGRERASSSSAR